MANFMPPVVVLLNNMVQCGLVEPRNIVGNIDYNHLLVVLEGIGFKLLP